MTNAAMSRSELIAALKAKRAKGALSKMRKADLQRMLAEHGGTGQHGGHGYRVDGTLGKGEAGKYKHVHDKASFPCALVPPILVARLVERAVPGRVGVSPLFDVE